MLLFTPDLARGDAFEALARCLAWVDVVQVRPKPLGSGARVSEARLAVETCRRVLDVIARNPAPRPLVLVNDRVDVACALASEGLDGVHLGDEDCPPQEARDVLGPDALIGISTHDLVAVGRAEELAVDYVGFGPIHATDTKGYEHGLGSERAWVASQATSLPLFPIGGITPQNVGELSALGRAAVGKAILGADDPAAAARSLREMLVE